MHRKKQSSTSRSFYRAVSLPLLAIIVCFQASQPVEAFRFLKLGEYLNGSSKPKREESEVFGAEPADPEDTEAPEDSKG